MLVKRTSNELFKDNRELFKKDFNENKKIVSSLIKTQSRKILNTITGYVTRLARTTKEI